MSVLPLAQKQALKSKLKGLGKCVVTQTVDDLFDEIFRQIGELRAVSCTLAGDSGLSLRCQDEIVAKVKLPRRASAAKAYNWRLSSVGFMDERTSFLR